MRSLILAASLCGAALECAIVRGLLLRSVAIPCFAAYLVADAAYTLAMAGVYLGGADWLSHDYQRAYAIGEPAILALLVLAAVESIGYIPFRAAAMAALCLIGCTAAARGGPVMLRVALLSAVSAVLTVSLVCRWRRHAALMLGFLLLDVTCSLSILLGETGTLRPGAFVVFGQAVPLVGWWLWAGELAPAGRRANILPGFRFFG